MVHFPVLIPIITVLINEDIQTSSVNGNIRSLFLHYLHKKGETV